MYATGIRESWRYRLPLPLIAVAIVALLTPLASAAELPDLEERCVAAGTDAPWELESLTVNRRPERKKAPDLSETYQSPGYIQADVWGFIQQMPAECAGQFTRNVYFKIRFKGSKTGKRWNTVLRAWQGLEPRIRYRDYPDEISPLEEFQAEQISGDLALGCIMRSEAVLKLEIVDEQTGAIIAVRNLKSQGRISSWFRARCLGEFSIHEQVRRCKGNSPAGVTGSGALVSWEVRVKRVQCARATKIAARALEARILVGGEKDARVAGWRCVYSHRGAVACARGPQRIYIYGNRRVGERCQGARRGEAIFVFNLPCETGLALAAAAQETPRTEGLVEYPLGDAKWTCRVSRRLDSEDLFVYRHNCLAGAALVVFDAKDKVATVSPTVATVVPSDAVYPRRDGAFPDNRIPDAFRKSPTVAFDRAFVKKAKVFLRLKVDPALVGSLAQLKIRRSRMKCSWTPDQGQTSPLCPTSWQVGPTITRSIQLKSTQLLYVGKRWGRGNWAYVARVRTRQVVHNGVPYRAANAMGSWNVINDAANCKINVWCNKR